MTVFTNARRWLSPLTTVLFVAIGGTGILMWLHLRLPGIRLLHETAGLLFVAAGIAHLVLNWRVLCTYFRTRAALVAVAAAILLCTVLAAMGPGQDGREGEGHRRVPGHHDARPW